MTSTNTLNEATTCETRVGWYIYVNHLSQSQARAILFGDSAMAAVIIGLATGGVGMVIAAGVYAYIASLGSDALNRCAYWTFELTYPTPTSRVVGAWCS